MANLNEAEQKQKHKTQKSAQASNNLRHAECVQFFIEKFIDTNQMLDFLYILADSIESKQAARVED